MNKVTRLTQEEALNLDPARSATLPARFYTSPDIFAAEREAIFFRGWQMAGHVSDLAETGSYVTASVHDQNVFICRGKDGALRGFYNVCAHRAHELLSGTGRVPVIICPYHAWSYHLTGALRSARGAERQEGFPSGKICLTPVRVDTLGPLVFYSLDPKARPMSEEFPGLADELDRYIPNFAGMKRVWSGASMLEANWKVASDNFLECYHCAPAHPAFADMIDLRTYRSTCHARHSTHIGDVGRAQNKAYEVPPEAPIQRSAFWFLWPMSTINLMPGDMAVTLFWFNPLSATRTDQRAITYTPDGKSTPVLDAYARYSVDTLQPEDNSLCESVQRGLASRGYRQGRFVVDPERSAVSEHAVHHFHSLVAEALGF